MSNISKEGDEENVEYEESENMDDDNDDTESMPDDFIDNEIPKEPNSQTGTVVQRSPNLNRKKSFSPSE